MTESYLSPKQKQLLEWIEHYLTKNHTMPSRREMASGLGLSSPATIQQHIEALEKKGFLKRGESRESRALQWTPRSKKVLSLIQTQTLSSDLKNIQKNTHEEKISLTASLPLLGSIAAGYPIEVFPQSQMVDIPVSLFSSNGMLPQASLSDFYILTVRGDSMMNEGILSGDWVILKNTKHAVSGTTVAALLNGEATLKTLVKSKDKIELHPANPEFPIISIRPTDRFEIQGAVVGLIRKFHHRS